MAMIDYGAVLFKNGVQQNHSMFMDMQEAVGWVDRKRIRYTDCDCFYEYNGVMRSNCYGCQRHTAKHIISDKYGEWDRVTGDCRGEPIYVPGMIEGNYFVYAGDKHLTVCVYKDIVKVYLDGAEVAVFWGANYGRRPISLDWSRRSARFTIGGVGFHAKKIGKDWSGDQYQLKFKYKGDWYCIVYGYGIDAEMNIWNETKVRYVGKRQAKRIDHIYSQYQIIQP